MSDYPPPGDQPPARPPYHTEPLVHQAPRNGLGIASLVLGIIGVITGIIPLFFWLAGLLGIIGLILGFAGRGRVKRGEATNGTTTLWGIITSALAMILAIIGLVILVGLFAVGEGVSTPTDTAPAVPEPTAETSPPAQE